ncbi:patatin-like phospholipase family protein [Siccirubricoccus sp. G192]|uniref:patatin-like phospholipase family protein n=1 Tax=Siccirubricoccus sp. G192 TaxID=2849651 RepID=UPI001C2B78AC|nr:patatin-like phospholipase family protein [Siccirubricoccus sp. G192]MBV1799900.1 patatin-like phospholipase family protein [Siccirubricoccus sp. G192]
MLDRLLEDGRIAIEAVSGTSAGALNAAALAAGFAKGGAAGARQALDRFWLSASEAARFSPFRRSLADRIAGRWNLDCSPRFLWLDLFSHLFSPYQTNPLNLQPLRDILAGQIDIEAVRACEAIRLFVTATNVRTGRPRVFGRDDISLDALLASACLPHLFQAVEIDGDPYWDGGYMGNPAIWPLIYNCQTADVVLVQINPLIREGVPRTPSEIDNRMNEIAFNSSLMHEMRAIAFVQRLLEEGGMTEPFAARYKNMRIHMIGDEEGMKALGVASKANAELAFLEHLKAVGRACAGRWLEATIGDIGVRSSVDVRGTFL